MSNDPIRMYRDIVRQDFYAFIELAFRELHPQTPFLPNWHIEILAAKLEKVRAGKVRRLIINVPPRGLKSICASVAFPAWVLGHDPSAEILAVSYGRDLSDRLARQCRALMTCGSYSRLFRTRLSTQKQATAEFETTAKGFRLSASIEGSLTGGGANMIIIDDPLKPEEALSEVQRKTVNRLFDGTIYSRLNNKETGAIILIMQRLHEDDLVGHVLGQEPWEVLSFPAIAEQDEEFFISTPYGRVRLGRKAGEALHPQHESLETLVRIRQTMGEYNFMAQYQQAPTPLEGVLLKPEWFPRYGASDLPPRFDAVVQSWDTANKATELSDYSVCTTWGVANKHYYLLDVWRKRMEYPELKRTVTELAGQHGANTVLIEDKASGTQLIQELKAEGLHAVMPYQPCGDKFMRLYAQTATVANGFVHLPKEALWLTDYLHELTTFPNCKHDDQADSTAQALAWLNTRLPQPKIFARPIIISRPREIIDWSPPSGW